MSTSGTIILVALALSILIYVVSMLVVSHRHPEYKLIDKRDLALYESNVQYLTLVFALLIFTVMMVAFPLKLAAFVSPILVFLSINAVMAEISALRQAATHVN